MATALRMIWKMQLIAVVGILYAAGVNIDAASAQCVPGYRCGNTNYYAPRPVYRPPAVTYRPPVVYYPSPQIIRPPQPIPRPNFVPGEWYSTPTISRGAGPNGGAWYTPYPRSPAGIRVMPKNPSSSYPVQQEPYYRIRNQAGEYVTKYGEPSPNPAETHIPLSEPPQLPEDFFLVE